jgi:RND family efflux transporter MFP subunit
MLPITPKVPGRLQRLAVDEGSTVLQGQVLAELDNRELAASVVEWEARVRYADAQFKRAQALYEKGTGTAVTLDNARNEFDTARASLDRVNRQLTEMTLTAPADGIIIRRDGEIGQLIQPGTALFWISCCGPLRISAEVDEEEIPLVRPGQKVMIRLSAFPDKVFEGAVTETTPKGDPVSRVFRVRIKLPPDTPLKIGMTADCNIVVDERSDVLLVPTSAVVGKAVWLVRDGKLLKRFVTPGVTGDRMVEVKAGLHEDDLVVVSPGKELREGGSARVRSKEP